MFGFSRYDKHANLVNRMSDTLGVDLVEETLRGNMPPEQLRDTVQRCMGCSASKDCETWLQTNSSAKSAPDYCRNGALFDTLAKAT